MKIIKPIIAAFTFGWTVFAHAQSGDIKVEVKDEQKSPATGIMVILESSTFQLEKKTTDINGECVFKNYDAGTYDIKIEKTLSFSPIIETGISLAAGKTAYVKIDLQIDTKLLGEMIIYEHTETAVEKTFSSGIEIKTDQIRAIPVERGNVIEMVVNLTPAVLPSADGKDIHIRGARTGTTLYIIDGEKIIGDADVPSSSIQGITVYTGGIPAKYGDTTGGVVEITTKNFISGMSAKKQMYEDYQEKKAQEKTNVEVSYE